MRESETQGHKLYLFDKIEKFDEEYLRRNTIYLSQERLEKVLSYRFNLDRNLSLTAYLLLRFALKENHGVDEPVVFAYNEYGKPYLRDYPGIHFNLSHCSRAVACILSDSEVGVDVQEISPISDDLAQKVLTAKEYANFKASKNPFHLFCEYWTIKESHLKRTGQGIGTDLTKLSAVDIIDKTVFGENESYLCCVAGISGKIVRVDIDVPSNRLETGGEIISSWRAL